MRKKEWELVDGGKKLLVGRARTVPQKGGEGWWGVSVGGGGIEM